MIGGNVFQLLKPPGGDLRENFPLIRDGVPNTKSKESRPESDHGRSFVSKSYTVAGGLFRG